MEMVFTSIHKRMFEINPKERNNLFTHATSNIKIRPDRQGEKNVYVVEADDKNSIKQVEYIVTQFAID